MSNNQANSIYGNGTVRLSTTLPADDGTNITGVTAATDTVTKAAHGYGLGRQLKYVSGTGFTGLVAGTTYYVVPVTVDTFKLAASRANAVAGTVITLGTSSSGVFTPTGMRKLPSSYAYQFGNITKWAPMPKAVVKEHKGCYGGVLALDKRRRQEKSLGYKFTTDEFPPEILDLIMGATDGEAPDPGKVQTFYGIAYIEQENEQIQADGHAIFNHYGFKCTVTTEGDLPDLDGGETDMTTTFVVTVDFSAPGVYTRAAVRPIV